MGAKLGSVGFGMGGPLALLAATSNRRIRAVVDFYGRHAELTEPMLHLAGLEAAVLGLFGERDACLPPQAVKQFETSLREAGKRAAIRVYPGVGHAFFDATRPDVYDAAAAAAAWRETVAFLRSELA
jgi:carboxymethylenebutenolidase